MGTKRWGYGSMGPRPPSAAIGNEITKGHPSQSVGMRPGAAAVPGSQTGKAETGGESRKKKPGAIEGRKDDGCGAMGLRIDGTAAALGRNLKRNNEGPSVTIRRNAAGGGRGPREQTGKEERGGESRKKKPGASEGRKDDGCGAMGLRIDGTAAALGRNRKRNNEGPSITIRRNAAGGGRGPREQTGKGETGGERRKKKPGASEGRKDDG